MTDTPKNVEELDERRARTIARQTFPPDCVGFSGFWLQTKDRWLNIARAIREADEAAGLVVCPAEATGEMTEAAINAMYEILSKGLLKHEDYTFANSVRDEVNAALATGAIRRK